MLIDMDASGSKEGLDHLLATALAQNAKGILLFACDANNFSPEMLNATLERFPIPIFGGIFPQILYKNGNYERGSAILVFTDDAPSLHVIQNISDDSTDIAANLETVEDACFETMFVFVDAFSTSIEELVEGLYFEFGLENNFIGAGAGSLSFEQKPVIFSNEGLLQDAVVIATTKKQCGIGVKHGWKSIAGPFQVTRSEKNTILELDHQPAFEVYKAVVETYAHQQLGEQHVFRRSEAFQTGMNEANFFEWAKAYPFGVTKVGSENVVRDPITVHGQTLICVGNVKTGSYVDILHGNTEELVQAAFQALEGAKSSFSTHDSSVTLFIDCISRVLFMEEDFQQELDAVTQESDILIGAMTLGEIANTGKEYLEFYNKTAVIGVF